MSEDATLDDFTETTEEAESGEDGVRELFGLGEIPADWSIEPLADIAEIIPGNSPPSSTYNEKGEGLPFFQGNSEFGHFHPEADTWCSEPRKEAEKNDVLMSIRAPVGDLNIADRNCCIGRGIAALRPKILNGFYLFYNLAERKPWLSRLATGSTFKSVTKSDLQLLDIPVPTLEEQREIATVIYSVDRAIEKTEEVINQTERVETGLLQNLFNGEHLDCEYREEPTLGEIPDHWDSAPMGEVCDITMGSSPKSKYYNESGDGLPFFQANNEFGLRNPTHDRWCSNPVKTADEGDSLMTIRGTYVGQMNIADRKCCIGRGLAGISAGDSLSAEYLYHFLRRRERYVKSIAIGSTFDSVNTNDLENLLVAIPPISEQKEIAETLRSIQDYIVSSRDNIRQLKILKQGLMQDLLSGTVRTTDTNIEVPEEIAQHG